MTLRFLRIRWTFLPSEMPTDTTAYNALPITSESSQTPWARLFPWTKVAMPRLEVMTKHPSRSENYGIPHTHALQSTRDLGGLGGGSEILCFCSQGAYRPLGERERKKIVYYKTKWRSPSSSCRLLGWKDPWLGFLLTYWQESQTYTEKRRESAHHLLQNVRTSIITWFNKKKKKNVFLPQ